MLKEIPLIQFDVRFVSDDGERPEPNGKPDVVQAKLGDLLKVILSDESIEMLLQDTLSFGLALTLSESPLVNDLVVVSRIEDGRLRKGRRSVLFFWFGSLARELIKHTVMLGREKGHQLLLFLDPLVMIQRGKTHSQVF